MEAVRTMLIEEAQELQNDPYAMLTMTYREDGFKELLDSIAKSGQMVPILLREGRILDGRHRWQACMQLGMAVDYVELGPISDEEALDTVIVHAINKATGTDASKVEAYLMCQAKGVKKKDMPKLFSRLNGNYINKLSYIEKENPEYLQVLLRQNSVRLYSYKYDRSDEYGTINGIWSVLRDNKAAKDVVQEVISGAVKEVDYTTYIADVMVSDKAEDRFWQIYELLKAKGFTLHPDTEEAKMVIEDINIRYDS